MPQPIIWQVATVTGVRTDTPRVKSFRLATPRLLDFRPGQHVDVRLTAPDGYQAQRSYSIASEPERTGEVELTVELMADGEVSPYFHEVVEIGDQIELRGPIGGHFTWSSMEGGPLLLIGGGSGVVPLMSMLRHRRAVGADTPTLLLYSSRSPDEVIYHEELLTMAKSDADFRFRPTLTRSAPSGWSGLLGRVDIAKMEEAIRDLGLPRHVYVCGSNGFVEAASSALVDAGVEPAIIATERFGPTGV